MVSDEKVCMAFDYGEEIKGICETIKRNIDVSSDTELIKELEYLETRLNLLEKKNEYEIKKAREEGHDEGVKEERRMCFERAVKQGAIGFPFGHGWAEKTFLLNEKERREIVKEIDEKQKEVESDE